MSKATESAPKMSYGEALDTNSKSSHKNASAPKEVRSIEVEKGAEGGHTVTHRFKQASNGPYHESEGPHIYGESEGHELIQHMIEKLGIKGVSTVKDDAASAAGAAD